MATTKRVKRPSLAKLAHVKWQVAHRSANQDCSLRLYRLLRRYRRRWRHGDEYFAMLYMTNAAFSLWRAVFLSDKKEATRTAVLYHALDFLERVILDNSIAYQQDKSTNEWTFNYYMTSTRLNLRELSDEWHESGVVPKWMQKNRAPKPRWVYAHDYLSKSIEGFERHMKRRTK